MHSAIKSDSKKGDPPHEEKKRIKRDDRERISGGRDITVNKLKHCGKMLLWR